ncbi:type III secretion system cytoplasmic ring protein SctQ [Pseudomonas sp. Marseille-QA0892]
MLQNGFVASPNRTTAYLDELIETPAALAKLYNRLYRPRTPIALSVADRSLLLQASFAAPDTTGAISLSVRLDSAHARLRLSPEACDLLTTTFGFDWLGAAPHLQGLLFEVAMLPAIEALEARLGMTIRFELDAPSEPVMEPVTLGFRVGETSDASAVRLWLECEAWAATRLADMLEDLPAENVLPHALPIEACAEVGWQHLTLADLRSLRPGDVVMLERPASAYQLNLSQRYRAPCALAEPGRLRLTGALVPLSRSEELSMPASFESREQKEPFDDVPVRLVCEIGRIEIALGDLKALGEGSVLAIGGDLSDPVRLVANGQCVGRGELVKLGTGLGVRVTSFASDE